MPRARDDRANEPANEASERAPARTGRRALLKLASAAAVAGALHPLSGRGQATATPLDAGGVLAEDLVLGPGDLARGRFDGTAASGAGVQLLPGRGQGRYTSLVLSGSRPFTHVGLHWSGPGAEGLNFELRSAPAGGGWSDWTLVLLEPHVPEGAAETFGALFGADHHTRIQFRASISTGARLGGATLTLIDASGSGSSASVASTAGAASLQGLARTVITREGWNADEKLRFIGHNPANAEIWPRMFVPVKKAVVHHTATSNNYTDAKAEVRAIYHYHAVTLGWGDIGYNALIDRDGNVYEGRYSRDGETLAPDVTAGHAASHNYGSAGIALLGTFTGRGDGGRPGSQVSGAMWEALVELVTWECDRHHLDPNEATNFLRWDLAWNDGLQNIAGHRDCQATICPGGHIYSRLPELRAEVAERLGHRAHSLEITQPSSEIRSVSLHDAKQLRYRWLPDTGGFRYLLEGWKPDPDDPKTPIEDVVYLSGYTGDRQREWHAFDGNQPAIDFDAAFDAEGEPVAGRYTFHVRAIDAEGSSFQRTHTILVTDDDPSDDNGNGDPPALDVTVSSIEPAAIQAGTSAEVTITGSGFLAGAAVTFENGQGPQPSAVVDNVSADGHAIGAIVSAPSGGPPRDRSWDVRVTNPDGSSAVLPGGLTVRR